VRIEHGTYTEAKVAVGGNFYIDIAEIPARMGTGALSGEVITPAVNAHGETFSKIYTNDVTGNVTFTLSDDTSITLACYAGTMIPLVTKKSSIGNIVVFR